MVHVNARFLTQPLTGVQRYAYEVVRRLKDARLLAPAAPSADYPGLDPASVVILPSIWRGHLWEQFALPRALPRGAVLLSQASGPPGVRRQIVTIHDLGYRDAPECYSAGSRAWLRALHAPLLRRARRVITSSEFSRRRIAETFGIPEARTAVVPGGVDPRFAPRGPERTRGTLARLGIDGPYLFALGAVSPRKNFPRLFQAWETLAPDFPDHRLVVVGRTGLRFSGDGSVGALPKSALFLDGVSDEALVDLYSGATAFVFPSLYEGFGLPPLEAMACGAPVVAANAASLPEVVGDAAALVDPLSVPSIAEGMRRLLEDAALRARLSRAGLARAAAYTWERAAALTQRILDEEAAG